VKNWFRSNPFLTRGILITPLALCIGFVSAGAGHGDYVAARWVLPFACLFLGMDTGAAILISVFASLQWPIYGFIIDKASSKIGAMCCLVAAHGSLCWFLFSKYFSERFK
jgi:hypothetical protein